MDWIEQIFGISLDGGNGTAEAAIFFAVALLATAILVKAASTLRGRSGLTGQPVPSKFLGQALREPQDEREGIPSAGMTSLEVRSSLYNAGA
jgi:hypothetical protein